MNDLFDSPTVGGLERNDREEQNRANEHFERQYNARQPKPKAVCTNCLEFVEWSRVDGAWWPFMPGTTEQHRCKR